MEYINKKELKEAIKELSKMDEIAYDVDGFRALIDVLILIDELPTCIVEFTKEK